MNTTRNAASSLSNLHKENTLYPRLIRSLIAGFVCGCLLLLANEAALANGSNYVSVASGLLSATATWGTTTIPGVGDTIEITSGLIVTNSTSSISLSSITVDTGGNFKVAALTSAGTVTNKGTLTIGLGTSARTLNITTNLVNRGVIGGDTTTLNVLNFSGNIPETWVGSGDITGGKINLIVGAAASLDITGLTNILTFKGTGTLSPTINGILIAGTNIISGNANATCTFTVASGGTLITANTNGIINGSVGTLNFLGTVSLSATANYSFSGTNLQSTLGLPVTVNNLTISNAAGATLGAATTINGALTLSTGPLFTTSANLPTVNSPGTMSAVSGYVSGPLAYTYNSPTTETFPVGKGGNARNVTFTYNSVDNSSTVTVEQFESAMGGTLPSGTSQFGSRYWAVNQSGASVYNYNLTVDGTGYSPTGTPVLLQQGSPDTSYSTTFSSPNYTASSLNSVGNFTLGSFSASADMLAFTTAPASLTSDTASGTITVQLQNSGGTQKTYTTNLTVNLTSTSSGASFRNTADNTTITSVVIPAGNTSASFRYRDTIAPATPTLTASANSVSPATQAETVSSGAASMLGFTTQPANTFIGATMSPVVVQVQDDHSNNVALSGKAVTLALNGASFASGTTTVNTDGTGAATFNNLVITTVVNGATLTAGATSLTSATSASFNATSRQIVKAANNIAMDQTGSWLGGVVPSTYDTAVFNTSSVGVSPNNGADIGASATWYGIYVTNWTAVAGYNITNLSGSTLTLGAGGLIGTNIPHTTTMYPNFLLATAELFSWNSANFALNLNGNIDNGGNALTIGGTAPINVNGQLNGSGTLTKIGTGTVTLSAFNAFGAATVSNGTLSVTGSTGPSTTITVASGGTLGGTGSVAAPVTIQSGGTFAPGAGLGSMILNRSLTLQPGSTTSVEVSATSSTSSQVGGLTNIAYSGTLVVTNVSGTLALGNQFPIFPTTTETGNFSSIIGSPGAGLAWSFNPTNGTLSVITGTATNSTNITAVVTGSTLTISWPSDHLGWILQGQTNGANAGISTNWVDIAGSGSSTNAAISINTANRSAFFRLRSP